MGRTTIADIARKAGLSTATVDRVLNRRAGVSAANRQRVERAAKELGYLPSEGMVPLPSRPAHLEFFIPFVTNGFMADLVAGLNAFAESLPLVASCSVTALDGIEPDRLVSALERVSMRTSGVGLVAIDHPKTRHAIRRLCEAGIRVVTVASDVLSTPRSAYVGVDNLVAGRTAALILGLMAGSGRGSVGLFLGARAFHGHREREMGFRALMDEQFPRLSILPPVETGEDSGRSRAAMLGLLRTAPELAGVYCVGAGRTGIAEAIRDGAPGRRPFVVMHDLTESTRQWLAHDIIDAVIDQNARFVAEQAVIRLLGSIATNSPMLAQKDVEPRIILRENIPVR
ncbi:MAG: LacI family DNA-binding transcriptional regulator [Paracoccaceae bacterium]